MHNTTYFYLKSRNGEYLKSSGEDEGNITLLPWEGKRCRKEQLLLWRKEGDFLLDGKGFALSVLGGDDALPGTSAV